MSAPGPSLLIITSEASLQDSLQAVFIAENYVVHLADNEELGLRLLCQLPPYHLTLLDTALPGRGGLEVLREARRKGVQAPVVLLTTAGDERERVVGFEMGADDCVAKPFSTQELSARVRAVLRRCRTAPEPEPHVVYLGDVMIDFDEHAARRDGCQICLTLLELNIIRYFIEHQGRTVTRSQLLRDVWGLSGELTTRTIDRHVASLRKKLEPEPSQPAYIQTVYGIGYRYVNDPERGGAVS